ncbi:retropepsin-like aspartic protease family protein [Agarilytica rhodophyticola]|uniref:retropepsin-like aspartic protease family protein n=1 Tax=Agarilytica rhodophyticola TaxID=1737490 RepID=UPI000B341A51|nr:TIGR02281 family clan AA aspartic protease [Agarilytica rhodophyticola]
MENSNAERGLGKGMLVISWIIVLAGLTWVLGRWEGKQYNPNQSLSSSGNGEITLIRNRHNHYVASGFINGTPVVFLLDTGATDVAVPLEVANKTKLKPGFTRQVVTANGIADVRDTTIATLELGSIKLHNVRAVISPGMHGSEILLGMSALKDLDFSQKGSELTLKQIQ